MEIRRLSPELCDDYLRFFDETPVSYTHLTLPTKA